MVAMAALKESISVAICALSRSCAKGVTPQSGIERTKTRWGRPDTLPNARASNCSNSVRKFRWNGRGTGYSPRSLTTQNHSLHLAEYALSPPTIHQWSSPFWPQWSGEQIKSLLSSTVAPIDWATAALPQHFRQWCNYRQETITGVVTVLSLVTVLTAVRVDQHSGSKKQNNRIKRVLFQHYI